MHIVHLSFSLPGDFVTKVKEINSQSDSISMSSFAGLLTSQSDSLYTSFQVEILVFSIFTISSKLDQVIYDEILTNVHFISTNRQQEHTTSFCCNLVSAQL